jgi:hypothetical protein
MINTLLSDSARIITRSQRLARAVGALQQHGVLPYLSQSYVLFFIIGTCQETHAVLKEWGVDLPFEEIIFVENEVAGQLLDAGDE